MAFSEMEIIKTILLVLLASVAAIIYSLRIIVSMDRKLLNIESHMGLILTHLVATKKVKVATKRTIKKTKKRTKKRK